MKLIRKGTFETNSSSCHSISIGSGDVYESITPDCNDQIVVYQGEFGWEIETYTDVYSRLQYSATYAYNYGTEEDKEMLQRVVCKHTGASELVVKGDGYIDHESAYGDEFESEETLKNFIFNADSYFTTDNDNH